MQGGIIVSGEFVQPVLPYPYVYPYGYVAPVEEYRQQEEEDRAFTPNTLPRTWSINANDFIGTLAITRMDRAGRFSGTVFGNQMHGFFDQSTQQISFIRIIDPNNPQATQTFSGVVFFGRDFGGQSRVNAMAGTFFAFSGGGGTPNRHQAGWYATRR